MALREEFEQQGNWLFRWRSYLPLVILPLLLLALNDSGYKRSTADFIYQGLCLLVSFTGLVIRCVAIGYAARGTSGRNTAGQMATTVNTTGLYSIVRHPLYLGNFIIILGMVLSLAVWWFALVYALLFWVYYERIMYAEEEFLRGKFGPAYTDWANATPAFIPRLGQWRPAGEPFQFKNVLRREYAGLLGIVVGFTCLRFLKNGMVAGVCTLEKQWVAFVAAGVGVYAVLRFLKKKTKVLNY